MICYMNVVLFSTQGGKKPSRRTDRQRDERTKKNGERVGTTSVVVMDVGKVNVSIRKPKNVTQEGSERVRERNMLHERENSNQALYKVDFTLQSGIKPWGFSVWFTLEQ